MAENQKAKSCPIDGCNVVSSGICLQGFDPLENCPNLSASISVQPEPEDAESKRNIPLPEGDALSLLDAQSVTRAERTRVVVVGGWTGTGKTTLITSIYESFLDAPFAGQLFAGSLTLPGFEKACHEGRMASDAVAADTARTNPRLGIRFYHLSLVAQLGGESSQLLIADMSGELLREACNSSDEASKLRVIERADRFVLLVDSENLTKAPDRDVAFHDARLILRSLVEEKLIGVGTRVDVVFSKWDVIQRGDEPTREFIAMIQREILSRFESRVAHLKFFSVAARPKTKESPFAFGVADLFMDWLKREPPAYSLPAVRRLEIKCGREFARFTFGCEKEEMDREPI